MFESEWESNRSKGSGARSYYESSSNDQRNGYYASALDGAFWFSTQSGSNENDTSDRSETESHEYQRDFYGTNLGYSSEYVYDQSNDTRHWASEENSVSEWAAGTGVDAGVVRVEADVLRQQDGEASRTQGSSSNETTETRQDYFGIPVYGTESSTTRDHAEASWVAWNRTTVDGAAFFVNPLEGGTAIEIIGVRADKGEQHGEWSESGHERQSEHVDILGTDAYGHDDAFWYDEQGQFVEEWLDITVNLIDGTIEGQILYEHGESAHRNESSNRTVTEVAGLPVGSSDTQERHDTAQWRRATIAADLMNGLAAITLAHWDEESTHAGHYEDDTIILQELGTTRTEERTEESDGFALLIDLGHGEILSLAAGYEHRIVEEREQNEAGFDGLSGGTYGESSEDTRTIGGSATSAMAGSGVSIEYVESETHEEEGLRWNGRDATVSSTDDEHWRLGTQGHVLGDVVTFDFSYIDGQGDASDFFLLGSQSQYQELHAGAGSAIENPLGGNFAVLSFAHKESSEQGPYTVGNSEVVEGEQSSSTDALSIVLLDGTAGGSAEREFGSESYGAGGQELIDYSGDSASANVHAGMVSFDMAITFAYADVVDTIGAAALIAQWCLDPGVEIPTQTVTSAFAALPPEAGGPATTAAALALGLHCMGSLPVPLLLLANPCLVLDLGSGLVMSTGGAALTGLVPAAGPALDAGASGYTVARGAVDAAGGCSWVTVPEGARDPQPLLWALEAAQRPGEDPLEAAGTNTPEPAAALWAAQIQPILAANWWSTDPVWDNYEGAIVDGYALIDAAFGADQGLDNPEHPAWSPCDFVELTSEIVATSCTDGLVCNINLGCWALERDVDVPADECDAIEGAFHYTVSKCLDGYICVMAAGCVAHPQDPEAFSAWLVDQTNAEDYAGFVQSMVDGSVASLFDIADVCAVLDAADDAGADLGRCVGDSYLCPANVQCIGNPQNPEAFSAWLLYYVNAEYHVGFVQSMVDGSVASLFETADVCTVLDAADDAGADIGSCIGDIRVCPANIQCIGNPQNPEAFIQWVDYATAGII